MGYEAVAPRRLNLIDKHDRLVILLSCALCVTSQLKLFEIQYLELFYLLDFVLVVGWFLVYAVPVRLYRPLARIGTRWLIFSVLVILLSLLALRQDFYVEHPTFFKRPFVLTLSRLVELGIDVIYMLFLAERLRRESELRRFALWSYLLVGMAGCVFALLSAVLLAGTGLLLGGVDRGGRFLGFNNEGGSFGTYLLTVIFVVLLMRTYGWLNRRATWVMLGLTILGLLGSRSKAAILEIALFGVIIPVLRLRGIKAVAAIASSLIAVALVFYTFDFASQVQVYIDSAQTYQQLSKTRPDDYNYVVGRVAGMYLAPKMIAAHPLAGIGLGNYPLVRDDPQYRQGTPIVSVTLDSPSLGPVDYIVDLGIPLFLYFTWIEIAPALLLVRRGASFPLISLVLMQPMANWFGAHLNITYPWVVAGIGLGCFFAANPLSSSEVANTESLAV